MSNTKITSIHARHLIDCKGRGLVEVDVHTAGGSMGRASAPTGTSVGEGEAYVMRDDPPGRFLGSSVYKAVATVQQLIAPVLIGMDAADQRKVDQTLLEVDGTPLKSRLGGNCIYSVSAACAAAAAAAAGKPLHHYWQRSAFTYLPLPICNMFNGGSYRDVKVEFQEFGVIPYGAADMQEAVEMQISIFAEVGKVIAERQHGLPPGIANYFGHLPISSDPEELFALIAEAVARLGYSGKVIYSLDCAASEFYNSQRRTYSFLGREIDAEEMIGYVKNLTTRFPFYFVEDILEENDFEGFAKARKALPGVRIIGDDLICTKTDRLEQAVCLKACDGFVFKPNQVGTISESLDTYEYAKARHLLVIPSVRAGGTIDDPVKDLAVALGVPLVKCGAPRSGERISFLNTLLRAADEFPEARFQPILELPSP